MNDDMRADIARVMGMKPSEILAAEDHDHGWLVTTHDGQHTYVTADGRVHPYEPGGLVRAARTQTGVPYQPSDPTPNPKPGPVPGGEPTPPPVVDPGAPAQPPSPIPQDPEDPAGLPPDGPVEQVLTWVGEDRGRAETALVAEQQRPTPRKSLITQLQQIIRD
ncbi:cell envelope integrity protein TolA [Actinomadura flavalba]|uniref:cell envelope integrity protein TolA n=1 Tax=Actinomadura flavalba TaxID=1120938 RepID=UPI0005271116|nr:cell envelope integrity protein TolA [Actinomadura flavalba]